MDAKRFFEPPHVHSGTSFRLQIKYVTPLHVERLTCHRQHQTNPLGPLVTSLRQRTSTCSISGSFSSLTPRILRWTCGCSWRTRTSMRRRQKFLNAGLLFEHYLSQLPNDPAQRSSEQVEQLETYRRDFETALDEGRSALASAMSASASGAYTKQIKTSLGPTAIQAITLTGWFYLVFHAYTTVAAGSILAGFAYGLAAFTALFVGLTIARLFKN